MKSQKKVFFTAILFTFQLFFAHDHVQPVEESATAVVTVAHACSCGPAEHWFLKCCIKLYNKQFPDLALPEYNNTEGLSDNILQAIEMLALHISFVTKKGDLIVPKLNDAGSRYLPMIQNPDYKLCKAILHQVDIESTLTAQELYEQWMIQLDAMKAAQ